MLCTPADNEAVLRVAVFPESVTVPTTVEPPPVISTAITCPLAIDVPLTQVTLHAPPPYGSGDAPAIEMASPGLMPAMVLMTPLAPTSRTTLLFVSESETAPPVVTAGARGVSSDAEVAGPPSPVYPCEPLPANVVITPVEAIMRMRWLSLSAT